MNTPVPFLGGLTVAEFLRDYWQKKPLLIRKAFPAFTGLLDPIQLQELACQDEAQSRLVQQGREHWKLSHGPFDAATFRKLRGKWTVLVQGVNHFLPEGAELLKQFNFIPHSRLDDLMVSYAPKGGGVGPHFDAYDVFLLQGMGHRRWQISTQLDHTLIEGAPLRILKDFQVEQEWVLESGDMLYLPPHCAHNGIAEDDCMTYSVGFRTPAFQELGEQFLVYLQDRIEIDGVYADPGLQPQAHPSEINDAMLDQVADAINRIRWDKEDIANFLGCYLSEPKPHIYFDPPEHELTREEFQQIIEQHGLVLDLKTQMLCRTQSIFINGDTETVAGDTYVLFRQLADCRELPPGAFPLPASELLYAWYLDGYLTPKQ